MSSCKLRIWLECRTNMWSSFREVAEFVVEAPEQEMTLHRFRFKMNTGKHIFFRFYIFFLSQVQLSQREACSTCIWVECHDFSQRRFSLRPILPVHLCRTEQEKGFQVFRINAYSVFKEDYSLIQAVFLQNGITALFKLQTCCLRNACIDDPALSWYVNGCLLFRNQLHLEVVADLSTKIDLLGQLKISHRSNRHYVKLGSQTYECKFAISICRCLATQSTSKAFESHKNNLARAPPMRVANLTGLLNLN